MSTLFLAPIPPPISGHSLASKVLLDHLASGHEIEVVDLSKRRSGSLGRVIEILRILAKCWKAQRRADRIYLTISESVGGNVKDLLIYLLCWSKLPKTVVHLHGGSIKKWVFDKHPLLRRLNLVFLRRVGAAVILGETHQEIFEGMVPPGRVHVVPNFAEDGLFAEEASINSKFDRPAALNLLFLTNLLPEKGFQEMIDGFASLDEKTRAGMRLDFAGRFDSEELRSRFLSDIARFDNVSYHGVVGGEAKKRLLHRAHALCLPTSYFEGQPICILEAYAAGCVVLSTLSGGIGDVFEPITNGFLIKGRKKEAVAEAIESLVSKKEDLPTIALQNRRLASERFRAAAYCRNMTTILEQNG